MDKNELEPDEHREEADSLPRRRLAEDGQRGSTPFSWPIFRSYRVRLRAHALRRGHLSASLVALTRPLLGLSFIYHPTPRLRHYVACLGLMVLRPAGGRGLMIPLACGSPSLQIIYTNFVVG